MRQADILDAALAEFSEHGFEGARMEDVARKARVSKGTVYLYYPTKQALFEALIMRDIAPRVALATLFLKGYEGPLEPALMRIVEMAAAAIAAGKLPVYPKLLIAEAQRFPDLAAFYRREVVGKMLEGLTSLFDKALARGEISGITGDMAAHLFIAPLLKSLMWSLVFAPSETVPFLPDPYLKTHVRLFLRGLNHA
ncbi:hypothetical protein ABAC402_03170 [Asticcacaulis sp. AC402]|nr:hypothetical protein ABAC402_03170 [Asticcacaulis sp. AC402]